MQLTTLVIILVIIIYSHLILATLILDFLNSAYFLPLLPKEPRAANIQAIKQLKYLKMELPKASKNNVTGAWLQYGSEADAMIGGCRVGPRLQKAA